MSRDFEPGVPVAHFLTDRLCGGVTFWCQGCAWPRTLPVATVCDHLRKIGVDPKTTGIRILFRYARKPCDRCGALDFEVRPHWLGIPGMNGMSQRTEDTMP